ncbi:MAG: PEP-CTERM sorting domain-containing protein [Acidobacteriota bacterium]|nr:PEP-CTERM sorting domain-containing protein [Acidobacteriota bacterium]
MANCGFETGNFSGWTVTDTSGNTLVAATSASAGVTANSGTYVALLGATDGGTLQQTLTDVAGQVYDFSFYLQNEPSPGFTGPDSFGVSVIDGSSNTTTLMSATAIDQTSGYTLYTFQFTGTGSDTISFNDLNSPSYYNVDDVSVAAHAPEPSSLALMGTGAVFFAEITRRRVKKA